MKNAISAVGSKKTMFWKCFLAIFMVMNAITYQVKGQGRKNLQPVVALVKYLGDVEGNMIFQVDIDNAGVDKYRIAITDEEGTELYSQDFKEMHIQKRFGLSRHEFGNQQVVFTLVSEKQKQVFKVSTKTQLVQHTVIAKH